VSEPAPPWSRLHPLSLVVNLGPRAFAVLRGSWPLLVAMFVGNPLGSSGLADVSVLLVFGLLTVSSTVVHFLTLRYRAHDGKLEIKSGLVSRKVRVLDANRIQNVELARNVLHRVFGLVEVRVETASGREVEGLLSALTEPDAAALIVALRRTAPVASVVPDDVVWVNSPTELIAYGTTVSRWGLALAIVGGGFELLPAIRPEQLPGMVGSISGAATLVFALSGAWVLGVGGVLVRHWGFRLVRRGDVLVAEEGLFTRRQVQIRRGKVQQVEVIDTPIGRWGGFVTVTVDTAAAGQEEQGAVQSEVTLPFVPRDRVGAIVGTFLPTVDLGARLDHLSPPHPASLTRARIAAVWQGVAVLGVAVAVAGGWGALAGLLLPIWWVGAGLEHRTAGWHLGNGVIVSRLGWWRRVTSLAELRKVQSSDFVQGLLMRRWGLARVVVRVAGAGLVLPALGEEDARRLHERLVAADASAGGPSPVSAAP
jgi:putative membrane protein